MGHFKHCDLSALEYSPTVHCVQAAPFRPAAPAMHLHSCRSAEPDGELDSNGQRSHAPDPRPDLYFPSTQREQTASEPEYPGLHMQSSNDVLAAYESALGGHFEQLPAPVLFLNWPAGHASHSVPSELGA